MKPAPFQYFRPGTLAEALDLLSQHGEESALLAGGQSLVPTMNFRLAQPAVLIDLNRIDELSFADALPDGGVRIGAMVRQATLERSRLIGERAPLLFQAIPHIAHPAIRSRGTVGGSLAHADPSAELPAVMAALDARFRLQSVRGERWVGVKDFYTGMFATCRDSDELLAEIEVPALAPSTGWDFQEVARRHGDYALVGVAAVITLDDAGRCTRARLTYLSVGDGTVEAFHAEQALEGTQCNESERREAARVAARELDPLEDMHASAAYKRRLVEVLTFRAASNALQRAVR